LTGFTTCETMERMRLWRFVMLAPFAVVACGGAVTSIPEPTESSSTGAPIADVPDGESDDSSEPALSSSVRDAIADAVTDAIVDASADASDTSSQEDAGIVEPEVCAAGMTSLRVGMLPYVGPYAVLYRYGWSYELSQGEEFATTHTNNSLHCNWFSDKQEMECLCDFSVSCGRPVLFSRTTAPDEATMLGLWGTMCKSTCNPYCTGIHGLKEVCWNVDGGALYVCNPDASDGQ
jgi:hypothetical protein